MTRRSVLRLLDANANRALEGLRVCEEIVRFDLEAATAFRKLRALRHAIAAATRQLPISPLALIHARESRQDIGRRAPSSAESSLERLLLINFQRVKESLRTLEECARLLAPRCSANYQRLRFRAYEVERDVLLCVAALRHP